MTTLIGHGALGVDDALRDFIDLVDESQHQKDTIITIQPILEVEEWSLESGDTYVSSYEQLFDGRRIDVVGIQTLLDSGLTRVESLAICNVTPGSYFYDPDIKFNGSATQWDLVGIFWDIDPEDKWDQFPRLFIHLFDDSNPNDTVVVAKNGFYYSTREMVQPALGPRKETNGDFEEWIDEVPVGWIGTGTGLESWDDTLTDWDDVGAFWDPVLSFITQDTSHVRSGFSSMRMEQTGSESVTETQTIDSFIVGKLYRVDGYYSVDSRSGVAQITIKDTDSASWIASDGRAVAPTIQKFEFGDTAGLYRRFIIDFRAHATSIDFGLIAQGMGDGVIVNWDDFEVRRIWRFNRYEPRVSAGNIPRSQSGSNDIFFGGQRIGTGSVSLINSDGQLERLVAQFEWMNQAVIVGAGGAFQDGQEIHIDDYRQVFSGLIQGVSINDDECKFDLQDLRAFFHISLPSRVYDDVEFPNMNTQKSLGAVRPIFFGIKENIDAVRIDLTVNDYGIYETCDTQKSPNGMKSVGPVFAYLDETSAALQRTDQRSQLVLNVDYSMDLDTGELTILRDVGPYEITDENNLMDFDEGGAELTAELDLGIYSAEDLASEIQLQMRAVGSVDQFCDYSESTHKITNSKTAGTLNLKIKSGTNKTTSPWKLIGYKPSADKTGSLSYEADNVIFDDVDRDHVIRFTARGFKDDSVGTFTGTANASIEIGADIDKVILINYMNKSPTVIDEASFLFARQRAPESLTIYLNEAVSTQTIFNILEHSNIANIVVNGEGKVFYKVYVGEVPDNIKTIQPRDIQEFTSARSVADIYNTIRVKYDKDPTTGQFKTRQAEDNSVQLRLGRPDIREFETYLKQSDNANSAANRLLELARTAARKISVSAIGGQFVDLVVGDKVKLTRGRALSIGGQINDEVFRIISVSAAQQEGQAEFELTDDRVTVASQACISSCQQFCENSCQQLCEQSCQATCETACQDACENSCQQGCEQGCQDSCQLGCEDICENACQDICQQVCQGVCEGMGCQTVCETSSCQLACQLACQTVCQADCQGACQTGCQTGCEVSCETGCEVSCETACEQGCQTTCQLNCQQGCEFSCQSGCEQQECQFPSESPD